MYRSTYFCFSLTTIAGDNYADVICAFSEQNDRSPG